jgi:hypothetical protein
VAAVRERVLVAGMVGMPLLPFGATCLLRIIKLAAIFGCSRAA